MLSPNSDLPSPFDRNFPIPSHCRSIILFVRHSLSSYPSLCSRLSCLIIHKDSGEVSAIASTSICHLFRARAFSISCARCLLIRLSDIVVAVDRSFSADLSLLDNHKLSSLPRWRHLSQIGHRCPLIFHCGAALDDFVPQSKPCYLRLI